MGLGHKGDVNRVLLSCVLALSGFRVKSSFKQAGGVILQIL